MVKIMNINLNYQEFHDFKLSLDKGKFYFIIGDNYSGREKLINLLSGITLTNNMISCCNLSLNHNNHYQYLQNIGVVKKLNEYSFKYTNVLDEMLYPLINLSYSMKKSKERINDLLKKFQLNIIDKKISDLNSLEKQKLLLVIALLHNPKILLIDNVLSLFSPIERQEIMYILKKLVQEEGLTVLYFPSSLDDFLISDNIILMSNYQALKEMTYQDLFTNEDLLINSNIEVPFIVDLSLKLKMYNVINRDYLDMKEMVDDIWKS